MALHAAGACKLPLLEAFLAEDRAALCRPERHGCVLAACRALGLCFHPVGDGWSRAYPVGPLGLARLAALGLVLELLVGEKELLASCPDEIGPAVHTR